MFPSEYLVKQHRLELLHAAEQHRLARAVTSSPPVSQRLGQSLLGLGARFASAESDECTTVVTHGRTVTVCPA
jgi:hypothetical protein